MQILVNQQCRPHLGATDRLPLDAVNKYLNGLSYWILTDNQHGIQAQFQFSDFVQTMAFVNAVAWLAQQQDHHPQLHVTYNQCVIEYTTHSAGGITENDLICAAKINTLFPVTGSV